MSAAAGRVTRFATRDEGATARFQHFAAHLRENGFPLGVGETEGALRALDAAACWEPEEARSALKAACAKSEAQYAAFDAVFDAFWLNAGRVRHRPQAAPATERRSPLRPGADAPDGPSGSGLGAAVGAEDDDGAAAQPGEGKLVASTAANLMRKDLRDLASPADIRAAEAVAARLGAALRDRRSRRRKAAKRGARIDLRRAMRLSLATGGEPLRLPRRRRPDRPVKIAALCDVSGSMGVYARVFLAFLAGLMRADPTADAYIFHTRLARIAEALREADPLRALNRASLLSDGFGGGSKIGDALATYARTYARSFVDARTVVLIFSDGYDSGRPERLGASLAALRRRGCRVIWLNPLKGWRGYAPVAGGMAAALPHLDFFAAATTLDDLAALEPELARL